MEIDVTSKQARPEYYERYEKDVYQMMIDIWGKEKFKAFCEMNSFKYRLRLGDKPGQAIDLELSKARVYENMIKDLT